MAQHPSLKISSKTKRHRSVLKRAERIKFLEKLGKWKEGDSVFGLLKVKSLRIKLKKEKAAAAPAEEVAAAGVPEEAKPEEKAAPEEKTKGEESKQKGGK